MSASTQKLLAKAVYLEDAVLGAPKGTVELLIDAIYDEPEPDHDASQLTALTAQLLVRAVLDDYIIPDTKGNACR